MKIEYIAKYRMFFSGYDYSTLNITAFTTIPHHPSRFVTEHFMASNQHMFRLS